MALPKPIAAPIEPLPEAQVDPRLPDHLKEIQRETYAKNCGHDSHESYQMSRWHHPDTIQPDPGPKKELGHVDVSGVPGMKTVHK